LKILTYNSSARGSGQFVRSLKIAEIITKAFLDARCVILAGNSYVAKDVPTRTDVVRMPEIRKSISGDYMLVPSKPTGLTPRPKCLSEAFAIRKRIIRATIEEYDPDVFLVDSRPAGLNDELLEVLEQMSAQSKCKTVLMLRDIVDDPNLVIKRWTDQGTYKLINEAYDKVVVLGNESLFDAVERYQMFAFREKVIYLGYLGSPRFSVSDCDVSEPSGATKHILVTVGGGFDGGSIIETMCEYISSTSRQSQQLELSFSIVLGSNATLMALDLFERYRDISRIIQIYQHVRCLESLIAKAHIVVSMCGYNTLIELIERRKKIIAIPRTHSGSEQMMRASLLNRVYDGMWIIPQKELTAERIGWLIGSALMAPWPSVQMEMSGARNLITFLDQEVWR
jgi:predicted glycosyltransferase